MSRRSSRQSSLGRLLYDTIIKSYSCFRTRNSPNKEMAVATIIANVKFIYTFFTAFHFFTWHNESFESWVDFHQLFICSSKSRLISFNLRLFHCCRLSLKSPNWWGRGKYIAKTNTNVLRNSKCKNCSPFLKKNQEKKTKKKDKEIGKPIRELFLQQRPCVHASMLLALLRS